MSLSSTANDNNITLPTKICKTVLTEEHNSYRVTLLSILKNNKVYRPVIIKNKSKY